MRLRAARPKVPTLLRSTPQAVARDAAEQYVGSGCSHPPAHGLMSMGTVDAVPAAG